MSYAMVRAKGSDTPALIGRAAERSANRTLRIGDVDDAYEQEAERVADEVPCVSRSKPPRAQHWSLSNIRMSAPLQRKCSCGSSGGASGECGKCKQNGADQQMLQRKASSAAARGFAPPIVPQFLSSAGKPLDKSA
jgi:hypothetical protein